FHKHHSYFINFWRTTTSSSIVSSFPSRISSVTQVRMCSARSTLLKLLRAALTADTWIRISGQYASFSTIFRIPRTWPSMRLKRLIILLFSFSERSFVLWLHPGQTLFVSSMLISSCTFSYKPHMGIFSSRDIIYPVRVYCNTKIKNHHLKQSSR